MLDPTDTRAYEVEPKLIGQTVTLRYDPNSPEAPVQVVHGGEVTQGRRLDMRANTTVRRATPALKFSGYRREGR